MTHLSLPSGLYELLVTYGLRDALDGLRHSHAITEDDLTADTANMHLVLHLTRLFNLALSTFRGEEPVRRQAQLELCNRLIEILAEYDPDLASECLADELRCLLQIREIPAVPLLQPDSPLSCAALFTGTRDDLALEAELNKEICSADKIDILCSFIKWSGLRLLLDNLRQAAVSGTIIRVITTSYLGATDLRAIEALQELPNIQILVSYDTERTRLHAKSYIFHRCSGFGTAYIGSSNISNPALTSGLEWNLKISQYEQPYLWEKICATFDTYQLSKDFERYDQSHRERLQTALQREGSWSGDARIPMAFMDIYPYPYQIEILDKLRAERELHQRYHSLVVAAPGTGKTVVAAFDFLQTREDLPRRNFLFVAHREEILRKSLDTFRHVLRDENFGDLLIGGSQPANYTKLFTSIQSLHSRMLCQLLPADYYDYIIIDEFHHAAAASYQEMLAHFKPRYLLGLTATPERHDGLDILGYFDGRMAAEIRLPDAITQKFLVPFQYFGVSDSEDLSRLTWSRGGYDRTQLENIFCGNHRRARLVVQKMQELILDISRSRCLCFCVSQAHAEFMNNYFNQCNIRSEVLISSSSAVDRQTAQNRLQERQINVICVVDLYNEGVDIPSLDTVLFLRPTESLTVFLQQLGRGLRLYKEFDNSTKSWEYKDCLTVLDFVGNAHRNFSFTHRFRALLRRGDLPLEKEIVSGFPHLPPGCHIQLEKEAQEHILANIRQSIAGARRPQLINRIRDFTLESGLPLSLANFLNFHQLSAREIYDRGLFSQLCFEAGVLPAYTAPDESRLRRGMRRICHWNSANQLATVRDLLRAPAEHLANLPEESRRLLTMLHFSLLGRDTPIMDLPASIACLRNNSVIYDELLALLDWLYDHTDLVTSRPELPFSCPLELHANYTRDEILVGLGNWDFGRTPEMREGVKYLPEINSDVFLITLNKSEKHYSPTTLYLDYAINDSLFHWQSQSTTSVSSPTGQRYLTGASTVLLFVREDRSKSNLAESYCFLGPATYVSHRGSKPISIEWRLHYKMPAKICRVTEKLSIA